ncbi:DJ-1/PfpI family protein [Sphingobium sp. HBC34]|uniref:DJ-1/PfpI family protein n=1 Tax=Sphingobium cyanobacteriorum TaxID=3063954 RepID=A0ABT8ZRE6_9SPHN|nr:DJ-1/PfpI family protein [Sphingobium sp. HBC34]MDO7836275.1 DJ-1/PfpI family protein [Sphingobium sp. HBC34]
MGNDDHEANGMDRRKFMVGAAGSFAVLSGAAACGAGHLSRNKPPFVRLTALEQQQAISGLKPPKRPHPVVAILADNRGSETTDLMIPYAVLKRAGLADVAVVSSDLSPIALMPALSIRPQSTLEAFDLAYPEGADYVIVPAFHHDDRDGPLVTWLRKQAASRATIIGICEGAKVLGRAGLLDGRAATTHWYAIDALQRAYPTMRWQPDRRYVVDRGVVTTTGVTASLPISLALVEVIGGADAAARLSSQLGVASHDAAHRSDDFRLNANWVMQLLANRIAVWNHETIGIPVADGVDDIALALTSDVWSRTYRSKAFALSQSDTITTRDGLILLPDHKAKAATDRLIPLDDHVAPALALDRALSDIASRYGHRTAGFVALQLEYPWQAYRSEMRI